MKRQIPNVVSGFKGALGLLVPVLALNDQSIWAFAVFAFAVFLDQIDGPLARLLNAETDLGKDWIDPISDALVTAGAVAGLILQPHVNNHYWIWPILMLGLGIPMKILKHQHRFEKARYFCAIALPYCYISTITIVLNIYAFNAFDWGTTGLWLTIMVLLLSYYSKRNRVLAWNAGLR